MTDARRALSLARARYQTGVETFTTVLTDSQAVLSAEMNLSQATASMSSDLVMLYKALGGGWETRYPEAPVPPVSLADVAIPKDDLTPKPSGP